jgi:hypothetical protein
MSKARKPGKGPAVYLVERAAYRAWDYSGLHYGRCDNDEGESYTPVRAFADKAAAEACRDALEAEARASFSPALFAGYSMPKGLTAKIKKLGLEPPKLDKEAYKQADDLREWWAKNAAEITAEQHAALWAMFDDVHLYRVSTQKLEG